MKIKNQLVLKTYGKKHEYLFNTLFFLCGNNVDG